jgi:uncharacterized membrane protein
MKSEKFLLYPERLFLILALFFGTCLVIIIPPFQSPDEYNHFFRAWQVSEGCLLPEKTSDARLGGYLPQSLDNLKNSFLYLKNNYAAKTTKSAILASLYLPLNSSLRIFIDFPNTAIYAPTAYFPQSIGIFIGRFLGFSPLLIFYLARWTNLLFWILIVYHSIKLMPFHKWTLFFCALLPASLVISSSLNADVITNALCFWLIASFLQNVHNFVGLMLIMLVTTLNKLVYAPFLLLSKISVYENKRYQRFFVGLACIVLVTILFWGFLSKTLFIPYENYHPAYRNLQTLNENVNSDKQMAFIIENPFTFTKIVLRSFGQSLPSTSAHLVGKFGWEKNYLPPIGIALLWLGLSALIFSQNNPLSKRDRLWIFFCTISCLIFFSITMYALWCPVGSPVLLNLQGRYFFPLLPLALLIWGNFKYKLEQIWVVSTNLLIWVIFNIIILFSILNRYYN